MELIICIFCMYLIYDLQMIAGGRYSELSVDDYVIATLRVYIVRNIQDIIVIFTVMIKMFARLFKL